jgi:hypothetical protein
VACKDGQLGAPGQQRPFGGLYLWVGGSVLACVLGISLIVLATWWWPPKITVGGHVYRAKAYLPPVVRAADERGTSFPQGYSYEPFIGQGAWFFRVGSFLYVVTRDRQ